MATEVLTRILCDPCNKAGISREGKRFFLGSDKRWFELDVCEEHAPPVVDMLKVLEEYGRAEGKPSIVRSGEAQRHLPPSKARTGDHVCPACREVFGTRQRVTSHVRHVHKTSMAKLEGTPEPFVCPTCGESFVAAQGLGVHKAWHIRQGTWAPKPQPSKRTTRAGGRD